MEEKKKRARESETRVNLSRFGVEAEYGCGRDRPTGLMTILIIVWSWVHARRGQVSRLARLRRRLPTMLCKIFN